MDTAIVGTMGLIDLLELRLGLHYNDISDQERLATYYKAMAQYMAKNPGNILQASFRTSGLSTAKAVLDWRDELRMAGWNFVGADISKRLAAIIGIEQVFSMSDLTDLASRLENVTEQISLQKLDCREMEIILPCPADLMKPVICKLLNALQAQGATLSIREEAEFKSDNLGKVRNLITSGQTSKISLDPDDDSLLIYSFPDEYKAGEYMAAKGDSLASVWINQSNKQMDNWLSLMGKPLTGSVMEECIPHLTQLFIMGMGLFSTPLNINTLIDWLNMPVHPINSFFRSRLADAIAREGGYYNNTCRTLIEKYIAGDFEYLDAEQQSLPEEEQLALRQKDTKKRAHLAEVFLPKAKDSSLGFNQVSVADIRTFSKELSSWANQRASLLRQNGGNELWAEQLNAVGGMANAMLILMDTIKTDNLDYKTIDSWLSSIYQKSNFTHAIAQAGGRTVVDSPAKILSLSDKTVWMGFEGEVTKRLECSFLYPSEKEQLVARNLITPWSVDAETSYHEISTLTPLLLTSEKLILVVCERRGGEQTEKHQLMVRLQECTTNLNDITRTPSFCRDEMKEVLKVNNGILEEPELKFDHADKIQWPDHLSPTSIGTLAEYPFDYFMQNLLHIESVSQKQAQTLHTTKGNVAHAVIAELFAPKEPEKCSVAEDITVRIANKYEDVYKQILEANGAILQLPENVLEEKLLHEQLKECLDVLVQILKDNNLKVTGCERYVEENMNLGLPQKIREDGTPANRDLKGFIDMTLQDENHHPVIIDFKWTSSRNYYPGLIKENRSVQLELYREMLGHTEHDTVERVAYFLMPAARLFSKERFIGRSCIQLLPANNDPIAVQLRNSIIYRKKQIDSGIVETKGNSEELHYMQDTAELNLFPLQENSEGEKKTNDFSNYKLFI